MIKKILLLALTFASISFNSCKKDSIDPKTLLVGKWNYDMLTIEKSTGSSTFSKIGYFEFLENGDLNKLDDPNLTKSKWILVDNKTLSFEFSPNSKYTITQLDGKTLVFYTETTVLGQVVRQIFHLSKPYVE